MKNCFNERYHRVNKMFLSLVGMWPEQSLFIRCLISITIITIIISVTVPELIRIRDVWGNLDKMIESFAPILVMTLGTTKLLYGNIIIRKIRILVNQMSHDWEYLKDPESLKILHSYAARGRFITLGYAFYIYGSMMIYLGLPLLPAVFDMINPLNETRPRKPLYEAEYGVNPDDYFFAILFHSYITSIVTIAVIVGADCMYFVNVQHACALFKIVGIHLKLSDKRKQLSDKLDEDRDFKAISYCISLHKNALSFANLVESTYSPVYAAIILIYVISMSLSGVLVIVKMGATDDIFRFTSFTLAQAFSLYLNSLPGQSLIDHSLNVHTVAYEFQWYEMSPKVQKLVLLILLRSSEPCILTAGKMYLISMESYSSVMQTTMSYFTIFSSMR